MAPKGSPETPALVAAAEAFQELLVRFRVLTDSLQKRALDSRANLERAGATLQEIAGCETELQARAQELIAALGAARDAQQAQAETMGLKALEIQERSAVYAGIAARFEAIGKDAIDLNTMAGALVGRPRFADQTLREDELPALLSELYDLQERMASVVSTSNALATDAREAGFEDVSRQVDSLRQQLLAARNKIGLLKATLGMAIPKRLIS
jgi:hypothetical protein